MELCAELSHWGTGAYTFGSKATHAVIKKISCKFLSDKEAQENLDLPSVQLILISASIK